MDRIKEANEIYSDENTIDDRMSPIQEFMQDQNHCCLCGSELSFSHKMDHLTLTVVEDAKCGSCHISLRTKTHSLQ
ncbi:hypothetical protein BH10BDE1_BH10BDE1_10600 [soil metagenome]